MRRRWYRRPPNKLRSATSADRPAHSSGGAPAGRDGDPDPRSAGTAGDAAPWGGSSAAVGMAAFPFGAHQAGRDRTGREGGRSAVALVARLGNRNRTTCWHIPGKYDEPIAGGHSSTPINTLALHRQERAGRRPPGDRLSVRRIGYAGVGGCGTVHGQQVCLE